MTQRVTMLTKVSPESTSRREMRLCPSLRSSYRSVTCLWAWGHKMIYVVYVIFIFNLFLASVVNQVRLQSDSELFFYDTYRQIQHTEIKKKKQLYRKVTNITGSSVSILLLLLKFIHLSILQSLIVWLIGTLQCKYWIVMF